MARAGGTAQAGRRRDAWNLPPSTAPGTTPGTPGTGAGDAPAPPAGLVTGLVTCTTRLQGDLREEETGARGIQVICPWAALRARRASPQLPSNLPPPRPGRPGLRLGLFKLHGEEARTATFRESPAVCGQVGSRAVPVTGNMKLVFPLIRNSEIGRSQR